MVVAAYPLVKIGLLLLKQISKPVANIVKNEAKKHPTIRKYVIAPTGRGIFIEKSSIPFVVPIKFKLFVVLAGLSLTAYNWVEIQTMKHVKGMKPQEIEKATEEEIVELGSNAIGEIILFGLLCIILLAEYNRQGDKKAFKEKIKAEEIVNLQDVVLDLVSEVENMKKSIENIRLELKTAPNIFDLEEQRHIQVHDYNFWDIFNNKNKLHKFKNSPKLDTTSPSI